MTPNRLEEGSEKCAFLSVSRISLKHPFDECGGVDDVNVFRLPLTTQLYFNQDSMFYCALMGTFFVRQFTQQWSATITHG